MIRKIFLQYLISNFTTSSIVDGLLFKTTENSYVYKAQAFENISTVTLLSSMNDNDHELLFSAITGI